MPYRSQSPCAAGCGRLVRGTSSCEFCLAKRQKQTDDQRPSARERGYSTAWDKARAAYLVKHPFCRNPFKRHANGVRASVVDHIVPHKGDKALFWDSSNWQELCSDCHNHKTATYDGGFGRKSVPVDSIGET